MADNLSDIAGKVAGDARDLCKRAWWVFLIGGIASVVFGVLAFIKPAIALLVLGLYFAAFLLVDGAVNIWGAVTHREKDGWWAMLLMGILGLIVGAYLLFVPPASMITFVYVVAFIATMIGVTLLALGWRIRLAVENEWVLYVTGALSVLAGLLIFFKPGIGGLSIVYMIAGWAIVIGLLRIYIAFRVKKLPGKVAGRVHEART